MEDSAGYEWRDHVVTETLFEEGLGTRGHMVRTRRYKYCAYNWGKYREQLFDIEDDPGEMVNLAVEERFALVLQQHRDLLETWIRNTDYRQEYYYFHPHARPRVPGQEYSRDEE